MSHPSTFKRMIFSVAAIAFLLVSSVELRAQSTYQRGVLFEEFTGTWCPHCPPGAWALDSMQVKYGDNMVELAWHGGPSVPGSTDYDPLWISPHDTLFSVFGFNGWPGGLLNRADANGFGIITVTDVPAWIGEANYPLTIEKALNKAPLIDYRIVNAVYNASAATVSFDVDITPYDMTKMRTDDTTLYSTVAVLAEDNVLETQENAGDWNKVPAGAIDNFTEMNVVRSVLGGAVFGNAFVLGTKTPAESLPIRIHYDGAIDGSWNASMIRIKTFPQAVYPKVGKSISIDVMEAKQTGYIFDLPSTAPPAAWIVLPNASTTVKPGAPTNIIWATGGNAGNNAKLDYTTDNGTTWNPIVASTGASPYAWTIPQTAYGTTMNVRITAGSATGKSDAFKTPGKITITKPAAGEVIAGGTADYIVNYIGGNLKALLKFEYSLDNGVTWNLIGNLGTADGTQFDWSVPNPPADAPLSLLRITDANGVVGISPVFTITSVASIGTLSSVKVKDVDANNHIGSNVPTIISWTAAGDVGSGLLVQYSIDNNNWTTIQNGTVASTATSAPWTTPLTYIPTAYIRVISADAAKSNVTGEFGPFSIGTAAGVSTNSVNGYSISNYPNPFGGETTINFQLAQSSSITLSIRDELGREISRLVTETLDAGMHTVPFSAAKLSNGVYTYTLEAGATKLVGKMSVVK